MEPHPILHSYADTIQDTFPLILIFGREPNTDRPIEGGFGTYDFEEYPKCGFWNTSYSVIGRVAGLTTREFKQLCRHRRGSPIVYADALPIGLKNAITDKQFHRASVMPEAIKRHITSVFALDLLIDRVALVMMSGLYHPDFDLAISQIEAHCDLRSISRSHVPFFYGTNTAKIRAALTTIDRVRISEIFERFSQR